MKKLTIELTPQQWSLVKQLHRTGLFGLTKEIICERFVGDALLERLQKPHPMIELRLKKKSKS